jgi:hypothetical protein
MDAISVFRAARASALGVWLGSSILFFIAAQIIFAHLAADRTKAGEIVGSLIHSEATLAMVLAAIAVIAQIAFHLKVTEISGWRKFVPILTLTGAVLILLFLNLYLTPRIEALRDQIGVFSAATEGTPERVEFGKLHGMSMGLSLLQALLVAVALVAGLL